MGGFDGTKMDLDILGLTAVSLSSTVGLVARFLIRF